MNAGEQEVWNRALAAAITGILGLPDFSLQLSVARGPSLGAAEVTRWAALIADAALLEWKKR